MAERMFDVTVHYEDKNGIESNLPNVTILAKDDMAAREEAVRMAWARDKREYSNDIKKILYCEITSAGTIVRIGELEK